MRVVLGSSDTAAMYQTLINKAPFDRTNQIVRKMCTKCGLDYMTQVRVGGAVIVVHVCSCGNQIKASGQDAETAS
jgi:hypothetical protein